MKPFVSILLVFSTIACAPARQVEIASDTPGASTSAAGVLPGVDVLMRDSLHLLRGVRVGLITNHSGRSRDGRTTIDLLHESPAVNLVALFSPEHGIRGAAEAGELVSSSIDAKTGLPIRSLYGDTRVPTDSMLADVDVLVYDIFDVGARVYTYPWTMALSAEAAGKLGKRFIVLDRPNPLRGDRVEGGVLEERWRSFVGQYPVALRYGLTPAEMLRYLVGTGQVRANIAVVPMSGWRRSMWYEETGLAWVNPSPNLRSMDATILYPGTVFFEATNLSEGRGTDKPFQLVGAKWLTDAGAIARALNSKGLGGVRFDSTSRTIAAGQKWAGETIPMIEVTVTDRDAVRPVAVGAHMLMEIRHRHPTDWEWRPDWLERLFGSERLRAAVENRAVDQLVRELEAESARFAESTRPYQLYR
jgi:uncharacterized protein YbbC (DUF1343 family)